MKKKTQAYWKAVIWIAENDEPTLRDNIQIAEQISVLVVEVVTGIHPVDIANDIIKVRDKLDLEDFNYVGSRHHY